VGFIAAVTSGLSRSQVFGRRLVSSCGFTDTRLAVSHGFFVVPPIVRHGLDFGRLVPDDLGAASFPLPAPPFARPSSSRHYELTGRLRRGDDRRRRYCYRANLAAASSPYQ
jgi:hypothetical protein